MKWPAKVYFLRKFKLTSLCFLSTRINRFKSGIFKFLSEAKI